MVNKRSETGPRVIDGSAGLLRRLRDKMREQPPALVLLRVLDRLTPGFLFGFNRLIVLAGDIRRPDTRPENYADVRWAGQSDLDGLMALGLTQDELRTRFARNARASVLERDNRVVAYCWCQPSNYSEDPWLRLVLSDGDLWYYDQLVVPEFRRQGLALRLKNFMNAENAATGHARCYSFVIATNIIALRAQIRSGEAPIGHITFVRVLGLAIVRAGGWLKVGTWTAKRPLDIPLDVFQD